MLFAMVPRLATHSLDEKQRGISLLELLLVLVGIAILTLASIHRYRDYHRQTEMAEIKSDITIIIRALNNYFHITGCNTDGTFPADKREPSMHELGLNNSYQSRLPLVVHYIPHIVASGDHTKRNKPIYLLQINVEFNHTITNSQLAWYKQALNATAIAPTSHRLSWQILPGTNVTADNNNLWILTSSKKLFQKMANRANVNINFKHCAD